jgi:nucleotide-binding universal stress UspA family protein
MATERKIIIAVDDSETSAYAFTWALHNLLRKSDKVVVLTVAPFVSLDYTYTDIASGTTRLLYVLDASDFRLLLCSCNLLYVDVAVLSYPWL